MNAVFWNQATLAAHGSCSRGAVVQSFTRGYASGLFRGAEGGWGTVPAPICRRGFWGLCFPRIQAFSSPPLRAGLLMVSACCGCSGMLALAENLTPFPKPLARAELVQRGIYGLIRIRFIAPSFAPQPLGRWFEQAGPPSRLRWRWQSSSTPRRGRKSVAAAAIPGLRSLCTACPSVRSMDLLTLRVELCAPKNARRRLRLLSDLGGWCCQFSL